MPHLKTTKIKTTNAKISSVNKKKLLTIQINKNADMSNVYHTLQA